MKAQFEHDSDRVVIEVPEPPKRVREPFPLAFLPAPEMTDFLVNHYIEGLEGEGLLHNEDHDHLKDATLAVVWTNYANTKSGVRIVGQAEMPKPRPGFGGAAREFQLQQWFCHIPDFLITLDAIYALECFEAGQPSRFLALCDHELYHCGQALDDFGGPKFNKDDQPIFTMRPHDVEEFVGVTRRWGAGNGAGRTLQLVEAAKKRPSIALATFDCLCGTCRKKAG